MDSLTSTYLDIFKRVSEKLMFNKIAPLVPSVTTTTESDLFQWEVETETQTIKERLSKVNYVELDEWIRKNIPDRICPHCGKKLYLDTEIYNNIGPLCGSAGYHLYCSECHKQVGTLIKIRS